MSYELALIDHIRTQLKADVASLKSVLRYKGEFEDGVTYDTNPPEVFIRYDGDEPTSQTADGKIGSYKINLTFYIVASDIETAKVLDIKADVDAWLDGRSIKPAGQQEARIELGASKLLGYLRGTGLEVYTRQAVVI